MRVCIRLLTLFLLVSCASPDVHLDAPAPATFGAEPPGYERAYVTRVVDGDTIRADILESVEGPGAGETEVGENYSVRLIGIDTPESVKPGSPVECFGREASAALKALVEGTEVRLVKDVENTDRYDRLLRYVYFGQEMANARMVANGYAHAYTYPPNVRHSEFFVQLEREARENDRGLWAPDTCNGEQS
ncbi:MAG: thermonuclease family protein [Actinomycetota bacterium]